MDDRQHEQEEPPRGTFLILLAYLLVLTLLWANVYLQLWARR